MHTKKSCLQFSSDTAIVYQNQSFLIGSETKGIPDVRNTDVKLHNVFGTPLLPLSVNSQLNLTFFHITD